MSEGLKDREFDSEGRIMGPEEERTRRWKERRSGRRRNKGPCVLVQRAWHGGTEWLVAVGQGVWGVGIKIDILLSLTKFLCIK